MSEQKRERVESLSVDLGPDVSFNRHENLSFEAGLSFQTTALVAVGAAREIGDLQNSGGGKLSVFQGWVVLFCWAFGAGIALVGWYPKLAGYWGYTVVLVVVGASASMAEVALFNTACATNACSFADLTVSLPVWMRRATAWSSVLWGYIMIGFYTQFCYTFVNQQILSKGFPEAGRGALPLYVLIGCAVFVVTLPSNFSGRLAKVINNVNLTTTWLIIVMAVVKGVLTISERKPEDHSEMGLKSVEPKGLMKVTVLLSCSMFQCTAVPQLNHEIQAAKRSLAAVVVPLGVAAVQGVIFLLIGLVGYFALGNKIGDDGDVFATYYHEHPDWMVFVLQGGIAVLMFLSIPLMALPPKAELWGMMQTANEQGQKISFDDAPRAVRMGLNVSLVCFAVLMPVSLGKVGYMDLVTLGSGTVSNWINLFLPSFVILWNQVFPAKSRGEPWMAPFLKSAWILLLATAAAMSSGYDIFSMIVNDFLS